LLSAESRKPVARPWKTTLGAPPDAGVRIMSIDSLSGSVCQPSATLRSPEVAFRSVTRNAVASNMSGKPRLERLPARSRHCPVTEAAAVSGPL
jgi:hypothetical protein